jgi:hypothetical protein
VTGTKPLQVHCEIILDDVLRLISVDQSLPVLAQPVTARLVERPLSVKIYDLKRVTDRIDIPVDDIIAPIHNRPVSAKDWIFLSKRLGETVALTRHRNELLVKWAPDERVERLRISSHFGLYQHRHD